MTRVCFITDQHVHWRSLSETMRVLRWIANDARERGCKVTLLGGDLLDTGSVIADRNATGEWLIEMAEMGDVVGVVGNHEAPGDCEIFNHLRGRHPIRLYDRPAVHSLPHLGLAVACIPWPHLGPILEKVDSRADAQAVAREHMARVVLGLAAELDSYPALARVGLAHLSISGAKTDHDQPIRGPEFQVSLSELEALRLALLLLGHIHAQNDMVCGGAPALMGGAPEHHDFGESGPKGYIVASFDGDRLVGYERIPTPVPPMLLTEGFFRDGAMSNTHALRSVAGAEVRFRYYVKADQAVAGAAAADDIRREMLARGALSVSVEKVIETETRARAPEVALAVGHQPKLEAHWKHKGFDPGDRRERLLLKADFLEEATREA